MKTNQYLIVVDVQKDFVDGVLGTQEAVAIMPSVVDKIKKFPGEVIFTQDTHDFDYLSTIEGKKLPVLHCIKNTPGWLFAKEIIPLTRGRMVFEKPTFGSERLVNYLKDRNQKDTIQSIEVIGICTDICVISNVMMIKAALPNTPLKVDANCCAGVTPVSHNRALEAMEVVHVDIIKQKKLPN
jgi:nicotinamidase-related amidase